MSKPEQVRPGSHEARRAGCTCDMIRNQYGAGAFRSTCGRSVYELNPRCRVHAPSVDQADGDEGGAMYQGALF